VLLENRRAAALTAMRLVGGEALKRRKSAGSNGTDVQIWRKLGTDIKDKTKVSPKDRAFLTALEAQGKKTHSC